MDNNSYEPQIFRLSSEQPQAPKKKKGALVAVLFSLSGLLMAGTVLFVDLQGLAADVFAGVDEKNAQAAQQTQSDRPVLETSISSDPTVTSTPTMISTVVSPAATRAAYHGTIIFTDYVLGYSQLLAISPGDPYPRIISQGPWNDWDPAASPEGRKIAFRSDRSGYQDLYWIDTETLEIHQVTDSESFEGNPTWSPDGKWLCYEVYDKGVYSLWIEELDGDQLYSLTNSSSNDLAPSWNPSGRQIAFISDRDGGRDIFLANLEDPEERFVNVTNSSDVAERSPAFSPDGKYLAYSGYSNGMEYVYILSMDVPGARPVRIGQGRHPAWSPDSRVLAASLSMPNSEQLVTYAVDTEPLRPLGIPVQRTSGAAWIQGSLGDELSFLDGHPAYLFLAAGQDAALDANERHNLVQLDGVEAPNPKLSDVVDEAFSALRQQAASQVGWDVLSNLENAFVGLNDPLPPGYAFNDWLYTGRAFTLNNALIPSGWAEVVREDYGMETYWRLYVRVLPQDGSRGAPLREITWDMEARYLDDPVTYDMGGAEKEYLPEGYYIDFTELARSFGFERVPAMSGWRRFLGGARFSEFAAVDGLSWEEAMEQIYPPQAIITPTPFRTPTQTPTRTPRPTATSWWSN